LKFVWFFSNFDLDFGWKVSGREKWRIRRVSRNLDPIIRV
jgi:hypothetical protein